MMASKIKLLHQHGEYSLDCIHCGMPQYMWNKTEDDCSRSNHKKLPAIASKLLEMARDEFSNHGCNDYALEATAENVAFVEAAEKFVYGGTSGVYSKDGKQIITGDDTLMAYCAALLDSADYR